MYHFVSHPGSLVSPESYKSCTLVNNIILFFIILGCFFFFKESFGLDGYYLWIHTSDQKGVVGTPLKMEEQYPCRPCLPSTSGTGGTGQPAVFL